METVWFATGAQFRMHRERSKIAHNNAKRRWLWLAAKFVSEKTLGHLATWSGGLSSLSHGTF